METQKVDVCLCFTVDQTAMQIGELDDGLEDIVFSEQVELITAQVHHVNPVLLSFILIS